MQITRFSREEFLTERWNYRPGEHVSLIAPTQNGKTTTMFDLLKHTDTSWCTVPPVMLVAKPQDPVVSAGLAELEYKETNSWPPRKGWFSEKPEGYGLWPPHLKDVESATNNAHLAAKFKPAIRELFWKGNTISIGDEVYHLCAVLGLSEELTQHWTQGAGMGSGLWTATQKPSGTHQGSIPSFMYNSPTHTFLGKDPDERNRKRFGEIGGVDPKILSNAVMGLQKYEWLYLHRDGPTLCIIEAQ
jgi:hypothetical protein